VAKRTADKIEPKIEFIRFPLRDWLRLEEIRGDILEAAEKRDTSREYDLIVSYLSTASELIVGDDLADKPWNETLDYYENAIAVNAPTIHFPMLNAQEREEKKMPWEYKGRSWYFWLHLLASEYHWDANKIGLMDVDDALGLYQEILINEQLEREWEWQRTELAYKYDETSKTSSLVPLPRPAWMREPIIAPPRIKIPKGMLPVGNVEYDPRQAPSSIPARSIVADGGIGKVR
jgi:hypothetical protein